MSRQELIAVGGGSAEAFAVGTHLAPGAPVWPQRALGARVRWASAVAALVLGGILLHRVGHAQVGAANESASAAEGLFQRGRAAVLEKDWPRAFSLFERSFRRHPSYDTAGNLGQAALKLERYADAADYLSYSIEHFPPSGDAERRATIQSMLEIALAEVGVVEISCDPADAELLLDGERTKTINPSRWYLSPGTHVVSARAKGHRNHAREIAVRPRMNYQVALELSLVDPGTTKKSGQSGGGASTSDWRDPIPIVLVGGGLAVASLAIGIGYQLSADSKESQAKEVLRELDEGDPSMCGTYGFGLDRCSRIDELSAQADERRNISYVGYGIASAALLATSALLLWPRSTEQSALVPALVLDEAALGFAAQGRF